jgi:hypothetical protein
MGDKWYYKRVTFLNLKHRLHLSLGKSLIERVMQYFKVRTECLDDYYPCLVKGNNNCDQPIYNNCRKLFVYLYKL